MFRNTDTDKSVYIQGLELHVDARDVFDHVIPYPFISKTRRLFSLLIIQNTLALSGNNGYTCM